MGRGRKRKFNPDIPSHIDQTKIPRGLYWSSKGEGSWYVFVEEDGAKTTRTVATRDARLSDLHDIAEKRAQTVAHDLNWLCSMYEASDQFNALASSTKKTYKKSRTVMCTWPLKTGGTFGELMPKRITRPVMQLLIDSIAKGTELDDQGVLVRTPVKARQVKSYASVMFGWAANRGHVTENIAAGIDTPPEAKIHGMPTEEAHEAVILWAKTHSRSNGRRPKKGEVNSVPSYLWPALEIAYLCRMRGSEVAGITDADIRDDGIYCRRLKGSEDNFHEYSPRLKAAVDALVAQRAVIWERRGRPIPMRANRRPLIVTTTGDQISKSAIDSAWNRMWANILKSGYLEPEDRFKLHGLKHRGVSDTEGTLADAREGSGHKSERMTVRYRHKVSRVKPVK